MPGALKAKVNGQWVLASSAAGGGGAEEVYVGPDEPSAAYDLWVDTSVAAAAPSTEWSGWSWPASLSLPAGQYTGLYPYGEAGATPGWSILDLPRPAGWAGPDPLRVIVCKNAGMYHVSGQISLSNVVQPTAAIGYLGFIKTDNSPAAASDVRTGKIYFDCSYNTYVIVDTIFQTMVPDMCVRFGFYNTVAGISTYSQPNRFSIWKTG